MTWSIARRVTTSACGAIVAIAAAILGLTEIAGGGMLYRAGVAIMVASFTTALVAFYVACSGLWAGWTPSGSAALRVRSVRVALVWAAAIAIPLAAFVVISLSGVVAIHRHPRAVSSALAVVATYAALVLIKYLLFFFSANAGALIGPAAALSFFLLASMCVALIGAAVVAWALRSPERVGSGVTLSA